MGQSSKETIRTRYKRNRENGQCTRCSEQAVEGQGLCQFHRAYQARVVASRSAEQRQRWYKTTWKRAKDKVFEAYGRECVCCSESREEFLTIDHVAGDGSKEKRLLGRSMASGHGLWARVAREEYSSKYRILCMNCNFAMGIYGKCPHGTLPLQITQHPANLKRNAPELMLPPTNIGHKVTSDSDMIFDRPTPGRPERLGLDSVCYSRSPNHVNGFGLNVRCEKHSTNHKGKHRGRSRVKDADGKTICTVHRW